MTDKWDLDPESYEGVVARPYYVALPKNWEIHKHYNTDILEKCVIEFVRNNFPYRVE